MIQNPAIQGGGDDTLKLFNKNVSASLIGLSGSISAETVTENVIKIQVYEALQLLEPQGYISVMIADN